jgi:hypothetical protein
MMSREHRFSAPLRTGGEAAHVITSAVRRLRASDGQALVEFAFVVPLFLLLVLGVVDFGRAYNYKNDITSLANQAARLAEVNACSPCAPGPSPPKQTIDQYVESTADSSELQNGTGQISSPLKITFCLPAGSDGSVGSSLEVKATATYDWLPFLVSKGLTPTTALTSIVFVRIAVAYVSNQTWPYALTPGC